ncbi:MAG: hypothetical protein K5886_05260 [Lachnospiraceae bacterium]|nr:hypothetical protein [Lachnospiraceae bacterium]
MKLGYYLRGLGIGIIVTALLMGFTLSTRTGSMSDEDVKKRAAELGMVEESRLLVQEAGDKETADKTEDTKEDQIKADNNTEDSSKAVSENSGPAGTENEESGQKDRSEAPEAETPEAGTAEENTEEDTKKPELKDNSSKELSVSGTVSSDGRVAEDEVKTETPASNDASEEASAEETSSKEETPSKEEAPAKDETPAKEGKGGTVTVAGGDDSVTVCRKLEKLGIIDDAADFDRYLVSRKIDSYIVTGTVKIPEGAGYEEIAKLLTGR